MSRGPRRGAPALGRGGRGRGGRGEGRVGSAGKTGCRRSSSPAGGGRRGVRIPQFDEWELSVRITRQLSLSGTTQGTPSTKLRVASNAKPQPAIESWPPGGWAVAARPAPTQLAVPSAWRAGISAARARCGACLRGQEQAGQLPPTGPGDRQQRWRRQFDHRGCRRGGIPVHFSRVALQWGGIDSGGGEYQVCLPWGTQAAPARAGVALVRSETRSSASHVLSSLVRDHEVSADFPPPPGKRPVSRTPPRAPNFIQTPPRSPQDPPGDDEAPSPVERLRYPQGSRREDCGRHPRGPRAHRRSAQRRPPDRGPHPRLHERAPVAPGAPHPRPGASSGRDAPFSPLLTRPTSGILAQRSRRPRDTR